MGEPAGFRSIPRPAVWGAFAALAALHLYLGRSMSLPIVLGDEFGYLASAAFFAGREWSSVLVGTNYYSFGYSLLLVPLYLFFDEPSAIYQGALTINALAVAASVFPAVYVVGRLMPQIGCWTRLGIALTTCLYPSYLVYANLAWAESLFVVVVWVLVALFCRLAEVTAPAWLAGVAGLTAAYLYAVHPRGLTVLMAAALVTLLAVICGAWPRARLAWFMGLLVPAFAAAELLRLYLVDNLWLGKIPENTYGSVGGKLGAVFSFSGLRRLVTEAIGQGFYLDMATYGVVAVGLMTVVGLTWTPTHATAAEGGVRPSRAARLRQGVRWDAAFILLAFALSFLLSVAFQLREVRGDQWVYGRYNEGVAGPLLLLGLAALTLPGRRWWIRALVGVGSLAALYLLTDWSGLQELVAAAQTPVNVNISGLFPYRSVNDWRIDFPVAAANVLTTTLVVLAGFRLRRVLGLALLAAVFVWVAWVNVEDLYAKAAEKRSEAVHVRAWIEDHAPQVEEIQFLDTSASSPCTAYLWIYQFLLPDLEIQPVRRAGRLRSSDPSLVISCEKELLASMPDARPVAAEMDPPLVLWVLGSGPPSFQALPTLTFEDRGLPVSAYRSRLSTDEPLSTTSIDRGGFATLKLLTTPRILRSLRRLSHRLEVEVTNVSSADWPATVHVGILWFDSQSRRVADQRAFLDRPLAAGEQARVSVPLIPIDTSGKLMPAGSYEVKIGLVHEGVVWFFGRGDETLDLTVEIE